MKVKGNRYRMVSELVNKIEILEVSQDMIKINLRGIDRILDVYKNGVVYKCNSYKREKLQLYGDNLDKVKIPRYKIVSIALLVYIVFHYDEVSSLVYSLGASNVTGRVIFHNGNNRDLRLENIQLQIYN